MTTIMRKKQQFKKEQDLVSFFFLSLDNHAIMQTVCSVRLCCQNIKVLQNIRTTCQHAANTVEKPLFSRRAATRTTAAVHCDIAYLKQSIHVTESHCHANTQRLRDEQKCHALHQTTKISLSDKQTSSHYQLTMFFSNKRNCETVFENVISNGLRRKRRAKFLDTKPTRKTNSFVEKMWQNNN